MLVSKENTDLAMLTLWQFSSLPSCATAPTMGWQTHIFGIASLPFLTKTQKSTRKRAKVSNLQGCVLLGSSLFPLLQDPYHWLGSVFRPPASCGGHFSSVDESQFIIHDTDEPFPRRIFSFVSWRPSITALAEALRLPDGCWQITNIRQLFVLSLIFVV